MAVVGGGGVNPFLSDSEESEPEESRPGGSSSSDPGASGAPLPVSSSTSSSPPLQQLLPPPPPAQAEEPPRVPVDALAAQLLRDQFVLTALELHTELLESGRELPRLRDYFSNPGNFERQSAGGAGALAPTPSASVAPGIIAMVGGGKEPGAGQLRKWIAVLNKGKLRRTLFLLLFFFPLPGFSPWLTLSWVCIFNQFPSFSIGVEKRQEARIVPVLQSFHYLK